MACPASSVLRFCGVAALGAGVAEAREPAAVAPATVVVTPVAPPPKRLRSEHVAGLLAAATPRFAITPADKPATLKAPGQAAALPANEIVHLPNFVVREPRVPTPEDVRTPRGLQLYAMNKYLGSPTGFSRGVLNRFTLADGWTRLTKHVPLLNRFEWASSPEKTALDRYYDDEVRKKMSDLYGLLAIRPEPPVRPGRAPNPTSPTAEPAGEKK